MPFDSKGFSGPPSVHNIDTQMVCAVGTPKRHPESGIYWFRKRVPERLRESVGKREIKFSLRTRDPAVARIRNLGEMLRIERVSLSET